MKPDNIFIDTCGDIKIGDFGLAKTTKHAIAMSSQNRLPYIMAKKEEKELINYLNKVKGLSEKDMEKLDKTLNLKVGTYFYRPPDTPSHEHIKDERLDLYALGIIIFEMWHPFKSKYERFKILTELRNNNKLPAKF